MTEARGLCLISIPKSGTMFLSRYLERMTGCKVVFGIEKRSAKALSLELAGGWHPAIRAAADPRSLDITAMCRRFALMLNRNRVNGDSHSKGIVSDHGHTSFLQFLINPSAAHIASPRMLIQWARERGLAPVFLYRSLPEIANSFAHFLTSGRSFLLTLRTLEHAAEIVADLYAPVLAEQTATWLDIAAQENVLALAYRDLISDPARWVKAVARQSDLPLEAAVLSRLPTAYRPWTYRHRQSASDDSWRDGFTVHQQAALTALCPVLRREQ